ncbi:hypothetical protein BDK51DRAFT_34662 [Blyttiomyces helicus]|uniref:Uncharacterized protein n=1 Tax=Blyttiomyces helicus TaxID=388810 RepID=A0A4P9W1Z1_9FUNG|nr:hypothetical protein BDK51DRAFT_34662 [Blyttiomyces helicus]|eukprot:RKO86219.1 hypothetical protein BDK51DRAFT_34662 [Blyttiomyces helicus]
MDARVRADDRDGPQGQHHLLEQELLGLGGDVESKGHDDGRAAGRDGPVSAARGFRELILHPVMNGLPADRLGAETSKEGSAVGEEFSFGGHDGSKAGSGTWRCFGSGWFQAESVEHCGRERDLSHLYTAGMFLLLRVGGKWTNQSDSWHRNISALSNSDVHVPSLVRDESTLSKSNVWTPESGEPITVIGMVCSDSYWPFDELDIEPKKPKKRVGPPMIQ